VPLDDNELGLYRNLRIHEAKDAKVTNERTLADATA
jgi:hypothetical protein